MKGNLDETAQFEYFTGVIRIHSKFSLVVSCFDGISM